MEIESSAEITANPLGLELTQKITEMMRHPKSDVDAGLIEEIHVNDGVEIADEMKKYDRALLSAHYEPESGLIAYLKMPEPGSPLLNDLDTRWEIFIKVPFDEVDNAEIVRTFQVEVNETNAEVTFTQDTLVYVDGDLQRGPKKQRTFDPDNIEKSLLDHFDEKKAEREFAQTLGLREYTEAYHVQIMEMLDTFSEENEVLGYDPANGSGIF